MTRLGTHAKITAPESARPLARAVFELLGATRSTPAPTTDIFALDAGAIGFEYAAEALTPEQMRIAPWLELAVSDVDTTAARLAELGLERIAYVDTTRPYFAGPAGVVFRLTALGS